MFSVVSKYSEATVEQIASELGVTRSRVHYALSKLVAAGSVAARTILTGARSSRTYVYSRTGKKTKKPATPGGAAERLLEALKTGPATVGELADAYEMAMSTAQSAIGRLLLAKKVERRRDERGRHIAQQHRVCPESALVARHHLPARCRWPVVLYAHSARLAARAALKRHAKDCRSLKKLPLPAPPLSERGSTEL